jgi:hypothetical protein
VRRVSEAVPLAECKRRALEYMQKSPKRSYQKASSIAGAIWPGVQFTAQGAGAAASRILKRMADEGSVYWSSGEGDWGWNWR